MSCSKGQFMDGDQFPAAASLTQPLFDARPQYEFEVISYLLLRDHLIYLFNTDQQAIRSCADIYAPSLVHFQSSSSRSRHLERTTFYTRWQLAERKCSKSLETAQQNASEQALYHPKVSCRCILLTWTLKADYFIRNLCAKEWVERYHGTVEEFAAYFSTLPAEELEVCYSNTINKFDVCLT